MCNFHAANVTQIEFIQFDGRSKHLGNEKPVIHLGFRVSHAAQESGPKENANDACERNDSVARNRNVAQFKWCC